MVVQCNILFLCLLSRRYSISLVDYKVLREKDPEFKGYGYGSYSIYNDGGTYY